MSGHYLTFELFCQKSLFLHGLLFTELWKHSCTFLSGHRSVLKRQEFSAIWAGVRRSDSASLRRASFPVQFRCSQLWRTGNSPMHASESWSIWCQTRPRGRRSSGTVSKSFLPYLKTVLIKSNYYYDWRCFSDLAHQVLKNGKWYATPKITSSCWSWFYVDWFCALSAISVWRLHIV